MVIEYENDDETIMDRFVDNYLFIREKGWEEVSGYHQPFQMIHPMYEGIFTIEEALDIEKNMQEAQNLQN